MIKLFPSPPQISGTATRMPQHESSRELSAYAEFGYRFGDDGLISSLATAVLATGNRSGLRK